MDDDQQRRLRQLDDRISSLRNALLALPRPHPQRVSRVQYLAIARGERYMLSKRRDDLEQAILGYTEAIFLPLPWDACPLNVVQVLFLITATLSLLSNSSRTPENVKWCITCLRYLHDQPLESFNLPPDSITKLLVDDLALYLPVTLVSDDPWDMDEMALLSLELLKSDISKTSLTAPLVALADAFIIEFASPTKRREPSGKLILCLREANRCLPDLHPVSIALAHHLFDRFERALSNDDYEEGTAIVDKIIASPDPDYSTSQCQALRLAAMFTGIQWNKFGKLECLEKEISRFQALLSDASLEDPVRPVIVEVLDLLQSHRRDNYGVTGGGFHDAPSFDLELPSLPSFRDLSASLSQTSDDRSFFPSILMDLQHLDALLAYHRLTDMTDIEEAIKYYRLLQASSQSNLTLATHAGRALYNTLFKAYSFTNNIEYLDESISVLHDLLASLVESSDHFAMVQMLVSLLYTRFNLPHHEEDLDRIMQLYALAVNNERVKTPERFEASCRWATLARQYGHPSTSTAYDRAVSLMQDTLTFAPTLDTQHFRIVAKSSNYEVLPLDCASHLVHMGQLDRAIETLEQGRASLWSEMRGLSTSIDQLRAADSDLAEKFAAINRELELLTLTVSSTSGGGGGVEEGNRIGHLVVQQRKLLSDRENLILQVRSLPGLESFLKAPSFDALTSAASRGPVIIINHSKWRSDILILLHNSPPSLITTTDDFYRRAIEFRDRLEKCRNSKSQGLDSQQYERHLRSVLAGLYDLIGRPVIERFQSLNIPEQSRVWWCPTSVFCSLPLHAMGPIPSGGGRKRYFSDLYIPSYTPTLSALIGSRIPGKQAFEKPSILLVAQPDQSLVTALPESRIIQRLDTKVTTLMSSDATPFNVVEGLRNHQFSHFVCHGKLEDGKPFDASFKLHDGKRLTLLDLIRSQLPSAEFAFLSACHTAEITEGSTGDEALHLTAAMQYCGSRSVVGTMWGMADVDGPELVEHFYKSMFSKKESDVPYYERSAEALRDAVRMLRKNKKGLRLERWVNFVHYGA